MSFYLDKLKNKIKPKDSVWLSRYNSSLGVYYSQKGQYNKAREQQLIALKIGKNINDPLLMAKAYQRLGVIYKFLGDFEISMDYFFKSRDLSYQNKDTVTGVMADLAIGQNYWRLKKYKEALKQVEKAEKIALENKLTSDVLSPVYLEKGNMLLMFGKLDESLKVYKKVEKLINETVHLEGIAALYSNIGAIYFYKNDFNKAISYYRKSLKLAEEYEDKVAIGIAKMNLGEAYYNINQFQKSEKALKESLVLFKHLKDKLNLVDNYNYLYELETKRNNAKKALAYFKMKSIYRDSIINENNLNKISSLEVKYKTAEKENKITAQNLELQTQKATIASQRNTQLLLIGGLGFLVLGGLLFYNRNKAKQKQKLQQAILEEKERGFEAVVRASEDERKRISKDLHDGIGQEMAALKMAINHVKEKEKDLNQKKALDDIYENCSKSADEIRNISHQMMPRTLLESGLVEALNDLLKTSFLYSEIEFKFDYFNVEQRFDERIEISLYRVAQELITNVVKHSKATEVNVMLYKQNEELIFFLEDNGVGMKNENKKGHGVLNIKNRIDMIKGSINYEPSPNSGTTARIIIPL
ncbi:tetratricopeptide repeat-containing sensor histidine kinase [Polaribacter septentrionalilitoris]|uniref:tetratricopeptide repeat-containing sensor histidine kinase n=1 Tax=Polaribacter septentrionalilitoris TaxID=2494657 RepID=UPI001359A779|nr:tetratricopeptide repeat protein [Polaribacter septentrionalilitoris]